MKYGDKKIQHSQPNNFMSVDIKCLYHSKGKRFYIVKVVEPWKKNSTLGDLDEKCKKMCFPK